MDGSQDPSIPLRRANNNERFVAFAFAGADMVAETEPDGRITFAAGAFRTLFGHPPERFVGRRLREMLAPCDHESLEQALAMLARRGRLLPMTVRMADPARTCLVLAGMILAPAGQPLRLCLSFARPPSPPAKILRSGSTQSLARAAEARMRAGEACGLELLEVVPAQIGAAENAFGGAAGAIGRALEVVAPGEVVTEMGPGRFGLLGADLLAVAAMLEETLRKDGVQASVTAHRLDLSAGGMSPPQAVRALRQALNVFARDGVAGMAQAGFAQGLSGYLRQAAARTGQLRRVIREGRFTMAFQPVVTLSDRATHHHEALIRPLPIPDCPFAGPQEFVLMVESLGLADELDLAVAGAALDAAARAASVVAFNLSGQSFQNPAFRAKLLALLDASPARRAGLAMVEMTETAEIEDLAEATLTADGLRALGVRFCLDDFGAGAADLRLLRALSANIVKLDGSYVPGVAEDGRERAFVAGMVEVARAGGAQIVAERVETEQEAAALRTLGVDFGQGWLFGRPGPLPACALPRRAARRLGEAESWG